MTRHSEHRAEVDRDGTHYKTRGRMVYVSWYVEDNAKMLRTVGDDALLLREVVVVTPPVELPTGRRISPPFPLWPLPFSTETEERKERLGEPHILT